MTLNPARNVFIRNYRNIAVIQDQILKVTNAYNKNLYESENPEKKNYIKILNNINIFNTMKRLNQVLWGRKLLKLNDMSIYIQVNKPMKKDMVVGLWPKRSNVSDLKISGLESEIREVGRAKRRREQL